VNLHPKMFFIACLSVLSIVFALSCEDNNHTLGEKGFRVSGRVTDSVSALPIDSVHMIWGDTLILPERGVYTDSAGEYNLQVPQSTPIIYARKEGYKTKVREIENFNSDVHDFDFELAPE
jgi:hypothetical protein